MKHEKVNGNHKKKSNIVGLFIGIVIVVLVASAFMIINRNKIADDYYAKIVIDNSEAVETIYFYWDGHMKSSYIQTISSTESWGSSEWTEEKVIKRERAGVQEILDKGKDGYAILNFDIPAVYEVEYKKGDVVSIEELENIINLTMLK